jgi:aspartate/methionine/tyrosine aminotransferase
VVAALAASGTERGYPYSVGSQDLRTAAADWIGRRFEVIVDPATEVAACIGTKEMVSGLPHWLRLRAPERDTVLYPAIAYPTYEMGAILAGARPVPYRSLEEITDDDARRALCLWTNVPNNPTGELVDLDAVATWGRDRGVPILSDECYAEFTWDGEPRTVLAAGTEGVLALHSLSKRSNLAGVRAGFYAGDGELVAYLKELRKHAGLMVPGPVQAAATVALRDDRHVRAQRSRYRARLERLQTILRDGLGVDSPFPGGGFYLWVPAPDGDGWTLAKRLAVEAGVLCSPGDFYGPAATGFVRVAAVQPDDRIELVAARLGVGPA